MWINHPVWAAAPGFADLAGAYPRQGAGGEGRVVFACNVDAGGALQNCSPRRDETARVGLVRAARTLIPRFRVAVTPDALAQGKPLKVELHVHMIDPAGTDFAARRLNAPAWTAGLDRNGWKSCSPPKPRPRA